MLTYEDGAGVPSADAQAQPQLDPPGDLASSSVTAPRPPTQTDQIPLSSVSSSLALRTPAAENEPRGPPDVGMVSSTLDSEPRTARADHFHPPAAHYPTADTVPDWEEACAAQRAERWAEKVQEDLKGWRGGNGKPRSNYTLGPTPSADNYYGQPVTGTIGHHLPKEVVRVERDWSGGEVCQFAEPFPLELQGRIAPVQWTAFITQLNHHFVQAYSIRGAIMDNCLAIATWWTSLAWRTSTFERELRRAEQHIQQVNKEVFHPAGLSVLNPRDVALQFLEIESVATRMDSGGELINHRYY